MRKIFLITLMLNFVVSFWLLREVGSLAADTNGSEAIAKAGTSEAPRPNETSTQSSLLKQEERLAREQQELKDREKILKERSVYFEREIGSLRDRVNELEGLLAIQKRAFSGIYEKMDPKRAARILDELDVPLAATIISNLKAERAAEILSRMTPERARRITEKNFQFAKAKVKAGGK